MMQFSHDFYSWNTNAWGNMLKSAIAAIFLSTGAFAMPAQAAKYIVAFSGTANFTDEGGYFGTASQAVQALPFTVNFKIDTDTAGASINQDAKQFDLYGDGASNPVTALMTINNVSYAFGQSTGIVQLRNNDPNIDYGNFSASDSFEAEAGYTDRQIQFSFYSTINQIVTSAKLEDLRSQTFRPGDNPLGYFSLSDFDNATGNERYAYGDFTFNALTISSVAAVPEPAAWSMMIAGFGLVGASMRRKKTSIMHCV